MTTMQALATRIDAFAKYLPNLPKNVNLNTLDEIAKQVLNIMEENGDTLREYMSGPTQISSDGAYLIVSYDTTWLYYNYLWTRQCNLKSCNFDYIVPLFKGLEILEWQGPMPGPSWKPHPCVVEFSEKLLPFVLNAHHIKCTDNSGNTVTLLYRLMNWYDVDMLVNYDAFNDGPRPGPTFGWLHYAILIMVLTIDAKKIVDKLKSPMYNAQDTLMYLINPALLEQNNDLNLPNNTSTALLAHIEQSDITVENIDAFCSFVMILLALLEHIEIAFYQNYYNFPGDQELKQENVTAIFKLIEWHLLLVNICRVHYRDDRQWNVGLNTLLQRTMVMMIQAYITTRRRLEILKDMFPIQYQITFTKISPLLSDLPEESDDFWNWYNEWIRLFPDVRSIGDNLIML